MVLLGSVEAELEAVGVEEVHGVTGGGPDDRAVRDAEGVEVGGPGVEAFPGGLEGEGIGAGESRGEDGILPEGELDVGAGKVEGHPSDHAVAVLEPGAQPEAEDLLVPGVAPGQVVHPDLEMVHPAYRGIHGGLPHCFTVVVTVLVKR